MSTNLCSLLGTLTGLRVAVLGEAMLDTYLDGSTGRFCPEAPVPVVALSARINLPGGAANSAVNARSLGGRVDFLSVVGQDAEADLLRQALAERGIPGEHLFAEAGRRTLTKQRVLAASQLLLRLDQGDMGPAGAATEARLIDRFRDLYPHCDAVIISDYRYGVVTPRVLRELANLQARWPRVLVVDSRRLDVFRDIGVTAVKPNYAEAVGLLGVQALECCRVRADGIAQYGDALLDLTGARIAAVTLDGEGAVILERNRPAYRTYAGTTRQACVAGAGDTFTAALALSLAAGAPTAAAAELASAAAAVVVGKERTATCSAQELREYVGAERKYFSDPSRLAARVEFYRQQGRRVVFTNGCFDILHRGHITYLHRAKTLGDVLIVGVNTDAGIQRLKGPDRPINTLEDRVQVLAALGCVDHLVPFDEETPCNLIRLLRPEVFAKGGDYALERLPEAGLVEELGGEIAILPYFEGRSTTWLIERIGDVRERSRKLPADAVNRPKSE